MREENSAGRADSLASGDPHGEGAVARPATNSGAIQTYHPLRFCPTSARSRYERRAAAAPTQPKAAIELRCLDCCGWSYPEVQRCAIRTCALYALSVRYFGRVEPGAPNVAAESGDETLEVADA